MRSLLEAQSEREPVEYTHYDMWFCDDEGEPDTNSLAFYNASMEEREKLCDEVIASWEESLGVSLHPQKTYHGLAANLYRVLDINGVLDLVIIKLLEHGYDVYSSDTMIEIYEGDEPPADVA